MTPIFKCLIPGRVYVKKNTKRVYGRGPRKRVIYSPNYTAWEGVAMAHLCRERLTTGLITPIKRYVHCKFIFNFEDRRAEADLSNLIESPQDVLVKAKVLWDDRLIYSLDGSRKQYGKENSCLVEIYEFES